MPPIPNQPPLPPEGTFSEIEKLIIDDSPANLWPENQNSNFGALRKVLSGPMQESSDVVTELFNEFFVITANKHLYRHEYQYGLPDGTGLSIDLRRANILGRARKTIFSRTRLDAMITAAIQATYGSSPQFSPEGIPIDAGGIILLADPADVSTLFRVYENQMNFSYEVWIHSSVTPASTLLREIQRITPAGITVTLDNSKSVILDYFRVVRNSGPTIHYRMNDTGLITTADDASGLGLTGTINGSTATGMSTSRLINAAVDTGGLSFNFDGSNDYISRAHSAVFHPTHGLTLEMWINSDNVSSRRGLVDKGVYSLEIEATGNLKFSISINGAVINNCITSPIAASTTYHVVATYDGSQMRIYVNGALLGDSVTDIPGGGILDAGSAALEIGRVAGGNYYDGRMDEFALYGYAMSEAEVKRHYNSGINVA